MSWTGNNDDMAVHGIGHSAFEAPDPVLLVAVDAGGSSTRAVVVDSTGRCLGLGTAGSGNPVSSGPESVALALGTAVRQAIASAGVLPASIAGAAVAMAGSRSVRLAAGPEHPGITAGLSAAGVDAPFVVESDLLAMFCAGSSDLDGHALVAGTGSAAIRVRDGEVEAVSDGTGWLLGDEGSGFWIGHHVVRAVVADLDGRGPSTGLTPLVLARLGIDDGQQSRRSSLNRLTEIVYDMRPVQLARFAPDAFTVGDATAIAIVEGASRALARTLGTVLDDGIDGPLVLGGSVLLHQARVAVAVETSFRSQGGAGRVVRVADGVAGAAVLALRHRDIDVDPAVFARIDASLAALRKP
jgi:N-acetylglucosamine kinase-like BadF-type ATPase